MNINLYLCLKKKGVENEKDEEIIKALKKAVEHKKELCEKMEAQWAKEGVKGKVMCGKV